MAKYKWQIEWRDGSKTDVPVARGHRDALRRATMRTGRTDMAAIRRVVEHVPGFIYGLVSWRAK